MFRSATLRAVPAPTVPPPRTADVWRAHPGYIGAWCVDLYLAAGLGLSALLSDPTRYSTPPYLFMRSTPGGITTWAIALVVGAILLLVGAATTARVYAWVLLGGTAVYFLLAIWITRSAQVSSEAAWWGGILFSGLALWHTTQAVEHRRAARALASTRDRDHLDNDHLDRDPEASS